MRSHGIFNAPHTQYENTTLLEHSPLQSPLLGLQTCGFLHPLQATFTAFSTSFSTGGQQRRATFCLSGTEPRNVLFHQFRSFLFFRAVESGHDKHVTQSCRGSSGSHLFCVCTLRRCGWIARVVLLRILPVMEEFMPKCVSLFSSVVSHVVG